MSELGRTSSALRVITASSKQHVQMALDLPYAIHRDHPLWVPPLKNQEQELLVPGTHPFWDEAEGSLFLALRQDKVVGRIAAFVDHKANRTCGEKIGAWGFFEAYDDRAAAHALFQAVHDWQTARGMHFLRGPLNPSTNYTCAMLVDGFDKAPSIMMPWNPPWYPVLAESWQMRKEQDMFAYLFSRQTMRTTELVRRELELIRQRNDFSVRLSSKATLEADIAIMFDIYSASWADNWGFCPMSEAEAVRHVHELKDVLDPQLFALFYYGDTPAGGMLALPNLNPLLKAVNGSIGLTAPWHYLRTRAEVARGYRLLLFGIKPEFRMLGLPLLVLDLMFDCAQKRPALEWVEGSWSLENNEQISQLIEDFGGVIDKRYRIYRKELNPCPA